MKKLSLVLALFLLLLALPKIALAELNFVATLPTLGAIAKEVGGDHVKVTVLASPKEDPHFIDARPDYVLRLNRADVLLYNGMEFEIGWLPTLQKNARNTKIETSAKTAIDASQFISPLEVPTQKIERSAGDIHSQGNPHYLYSLPNVIAVAEGLNRKLAEIDPENESSYDANTRAFVARAQAKSDAWKAKFSALPEASRRIVSYHASLVYLRTWLDLTQVETLEAKPGIAPNPSHMAKVVTAMRNDKIKVILQETYQPTSTSKKAAQLSQATLVVFAPGPDVAKGEDILDYNDKFLGNLYDALTK